MKLEDIFAQHLGPYAYVYMMYAKGKRVKIGQTLRLAARKASIRSDMGCPILLMGYVMASPTLETELHRYFRSLHDNGDWFFHDDKLNALARLMNALRAHQRWSMEVLDCSGWAPKPSEVVAAGKLKPSCYQNPKVPFPDT